MAQEQGLGSRALPGSQTLLDALLRNLYDFGEAEDEAEQKSIRKRVENKKRGAGTPVAVATEPAPLPGSSVRGQRKSASSFFKGLREELQCAPAVSPTGSPSGPGVPSAAVFPSTLKNNREPVEVIEFHSGNKKRKEKLGEDEDTQTKTSIPEKDVDRQEFNLEKPPKNSYVNYKVLQEQIKEKKAAKEEEKRTAQDTDIFKKKKRRGQEDRKSKKKKSAPGILSSGRIGQVGRFKNGTLILSQVDIKKINSSRVAK
ncbi:uncharacterized protein C1orf131 homolog isoform X2 [Zalophus californianus]|uniref:Uncharacterized protein C1orf131 homolog isoform X2 n=1 Tax=Zalophus californianus TaxID=9704 RepID=A0A6J2DBL2_ZALCA|nr:uncharacterized protein C1orf131 homolog isoform X2 [Zalophus californianus]